MSAAGWRGVLADCRHGYAVLRLDRMLVLCLFAFLFKACKTRCAHPNWVGYRAIKINIFLLALGASPFPSAGLPTSTDLCPRDDL